MTLTDGQQEFLRELAWDAIRSRLADRPFAVELPAAGILAEPGSAFVTLKKAGRLRGCVGMIFDRYPLGRAVREAALAAMDDPRFPALTAAEAEEVDLTVSHLGPFVTVEDPAEVVAGEHGVYVTDGTRSALLLPQVAAERNWDTERLLTEVCRKAGLDGARWRQPGLTLEVFMGSEF
ncbi:MAG: AmmeMemoRadiSam system protein A [Planctomycetota bacterium]